MLRFVRAAVVLSVLGAVLAPGALAGTSAGQPFPSNRYTVHDSSQVTRLRVNLPKPNCTTNPTDCADIDVLNTLDGFNVQPRISIPFSGPIDPASVKKGTIFLIGPRGHLVGFNQAVWEPAANTLHVESDELLDQHSTYLLVVTRGIRDAAGRPLDPIRLGHGHGHDGHDGHDGNRGDDGHNDGRHDDDEDDDELAAGLTGAFLGGVGPHGIAAASIFTTQSITEISEKIRDQIRSAPAPTPSFALGPAGSRTVFPLAGITSIAWNRINPTPPSAAVVPLPLAALQVFPGSIGTLAFGTYASPNYETADMVIPAVGTRKGNPAVQSTNQVQFTLFEPSGSAPPGGWPVVLFGHGFTDSKNGAPWAVASTFAHAGLATIAINVVGHGFNPAGTYTVSQGTAVPPVTFGAGGRGVDQNSNGLYDSTEGVSAVGANSLIGNRDGLRQTVVDLMQLVRVLGAGVDVDGDGTADLSTTRLYYSGQSFGGIYGVPLLGLEPKIRAGVPNVPGGSITEIARLSPSFRGLIGSALFTRVPSLYNFGNPFTPPLFQSFIENVPLRNLPLLVDNVAGASAIQTVLDNNEWAQNAANPAAYADHILSPVIIQFARGDMTVPNPTASAIIRAGNLASRTTLFRNDLAFASNPAFGKNPHTFLTNIGSAVQAPVAIQAQVQIATFFASDGATVIDPDGAGVLFETPTSMVPEDLAYIP
jgi:Bacterial Ig-like domain